MECTPLYLGSVLLLTVILPIASLAAEHFFLQTSIPLAALVGKWFVFWAAGVRLFLAGLRQLFQPQFTANQIFRMTTEEALPVVRELGIANLAVGAVGIISLWMPSFVLPIAIVGAIFYGIAGINHTREKRRSRNESIAMTTDLWVSLVLIAYVVVALAS